MRRLPTLWLICVLALACLPPSVQARPAAAPDPIERQIAALQTSLTPAERVAQLMLVTFDGTYLGPDSPVAQLITDYNIGGVVLLARNDNINGQVNTPRLVQTLTTELQQLAYDAAEATQQRAVPRSFVPMLIATSHTGNGPLETEIAQETTPLPSLLTLGATWEPEFAREVGEIAGAELHAMGINMLLGPALDIYQQPQSERTLNLGVNTFGGEPFWVGQMAQAYIEGAHTGSQDRLAVIAQNFPGLGLADTSPDLEIPVVPHSANELRQFDLLPYFAVTGQASTAARADGLQCANIRYQGENASSITRPVCLDEQAAAQLLELEEFGDWRQRGIVISSPLGSQAIRRYYGTEPFPHRQVAREAFLAGNDILYLADFGPEPGQDQISNVIDVIKFFAERYESDPVFHVQIDQSLTRVLRLKLTLYDGDFSLSNVLTPLVDIDLVGSQNAPLYNIAERSATLLAPTRQSLLPPPARDENIVIFTDVRAVQQCSYCAAYPVVSVNALEVAIERLYGPFAGDQVRPDQVISFSFSQLYAYLSGSMEDTQQSGQLKTNQRIAEALRTADWIVFIMHDVVPDIPASSVVSYFLQTEDTVLNHAHTVVVALDAPVYLSATEIGKLSAYYGFYSATPPTIDAVARALFQESGFTGALPISLPAVGYNIFQATDPAPDQTIQLVVEALNERPAPTAFASGEGLVIAIGDKLTIRTNVILDHNGHPVPDNTPVEFTLVFVNENLQTRQQGKTHNGRASTSITPSRPGRIEVTAASQDAVRSTMLQIRILEDSAAAALSPPSINETPALPTGGTPQAGETASPVPGATLPAGSEQPTAMLEQLLSADNGTSVSTGPAGDLDRLDMSDFVLMLFGLALMGALGFFAGVSSTSTLNGGIRVVLGSVVAGLIGYIYYGIEGPGAAEIEARLQNIAPLVTALSTGLVGLVIAWWTLRHTH